MSDLPPESEAVVSDDQELVSLSNDDDMNLQDGHQSVDELGETDGRSKANQLHCSHCDERYRQPRILQCLHVFCTPCLERLAEEHGLGIASPEECKAIVCPSCKQETRVGAIGKLPIDVIMMNMMDVADIREKRMLCTSCKAQEKAVARCCDCASFLCPNCVTAHKFMRCFENHKVDSFEDLLNVGHIDIHKPFFCSLHPVESVKFFCNSCQIPVCSECMLCMHKIPDHSCERIIDVEERQLKELQSIVTETKTKMNSCETMSADLEAMLADLQQQHDFAHDLIKETCQSYKAILDKRQESLLKELEEIHTTNELAIMDMFNNIQKTVERIDDGCQFTERILQHGNGVEILSLKKHVTQQLLTLLNNVPCLEPPVKVEFETDTEKFSAAVNATFGHFRRPSDPRKVLSDHHDAISLQSSFEGDQFNAAGGLLSPLMAAVADFMPGLAGLASTSPDLTSGLAGSGIPGLPLHDSVVGKLGGILPAVSAAPLNMPSMQTGSSSAFQEHSMSRNSYSPAMSDSGISMDAASTGSLGGLNLDALSKLRSSLSVNAQGQITVHGQTIPGLNINSSTSGAPILASRALSLPPVSDSTSLAGLLNSVSLTPAAQLASPAAQLSDISSLLSTISPTAQQLFNMNVGGGTGGRDGSPITSAVTAASLLAGPSSSGLQLNGVGSQSSSHFGVGDAPLHPRSSGKTGAMQIRCKFGQLGPSKGQFNSPHGFCLGMDEDIVVADTNNHRIQIFEKSGEFKYQFGISGRDEGQLWYPRKVAVIRSTGKYVVCDRGSERSRMQLFTKTGQFIKKIGIRYIDIVAGLAISSQGHIVAVDSVSPTVFCINENGDLVRWFDCSDYMREPSDIAISGKEYYVCDFKGHCVVVFSEEGQFMHRIGCENITNYPNGIDISDAGDILVGDSHGNRFHIAVFQRDGSLIGEFECPYVKVSRCCGLKITSEGYVVTLAKNNQHVLVLNTLYIA